MVQSVIGLLYILLQYTKHLVQDGYGCQVILRRRSQAGGEARGANKTTDNALASVREHIGSIQQVPSHWCRRTAMKYLPSELSIARFYRMYCQHHVDYNDKSFQTVEPWCGTQDRSKSIEITSFERKTKHNHYSSLRGKSILIHVPVSFRNNEFLRFLVTNFCGTNQENVNEFVPACRVVNSPTIGHTICPSKNVFTQRCYLLGAYTKTNIELFDEKLQKST